jgi:hypothetical protein
VSGIDKFSYNVANITYNKSGPATSLQASSLTYNGNFKHEDQEIQLQNMLIISHSKQIFKNIEVTQNSHRNNPSAKVARRNSNAVSASFNRQS